MKKILAIIATAIIMPQLFAQSDADALRYSILDFGGTARSLGSANAYGAVGGDFSSVSINPAGLGIYRSSEFIFSPSLGNSKTSSNFIGETNEATKYNFNISNIGLVFASPKSGKQNAKEGFAGGAFAIGYNRLANYNSEVYYSGFNSSSSLLDSYTEFLNNKGGTNTSDVFNSDPFGAGLAWETYLINPNPDSVTYYGVINGGNVQQSKSIITSGGYDEFTLSFAGNYENKLYMGATLGIPSINYRSTSTYQEDDINSVHPDFENFTLENNLHTTGIGVNGKFGLIYRINNYVRLGAAIHTPSLFSMSDSYNSNMQSSLDVSGSYSFDSPRGQYDYKLVTPWRAIASAAFTFQNRGFISIDYEWLDYSTANFNFNRLGTSQESEIENNVNSSIDTKYGTASNIRIGGEFVYDIFRFRGGYAISGSPFNTGIATATADYGKQTYTAGIGIKEKSYFIDFAYARTMSTEYDIEYLQSNPSIPNEGALIDKTFNNFLLSIGFRF